MTEELVRAAWGDRDAAERYESSRPSYPETAIDMLADELGMGPGRRVLDLGAGTGKLTRQLLRTGADVIAVEPLEGMRAAFASVLPNVPVLNGKAEAIPVPDSSVDAIVAGQAWHWFDPEAATAEATRVLRPRGGVGLLWNSYDRTVPLTRELAALREHYDQDLSPNYEEDRWQDAFTEEKGWAPLEQRQFSHSQTISRDGVANRLLSTSIFAVFDADQHEAVRQEVMRLLERYAPPGETVTLPYLTNVFWTQRR